MLLEAFAWWLGECLRCTSEAPGNEPLGFDVMSDVAAILRKCLDGDRLDPGEAVALLHSDAGEEIGVAADEIRKRWHPDGVVSFIVDRNVKYTHVCVARCTFCK